MHILDVRRSGGRSIPDSPGSAFCISMQDITQFANNSGHMAGKWWILMKGLKLVFVFRVKWWGLVIITETYRKTFYKVDLYNKLILSQHQLDTDPIPWGFAYSTVSEKQGS